MSTRPATLLVALFLLAPHLVAAQSPRLVVEVEAGPVWQSSNNVEIPNDGTATRFSLVDAVGSGPWPAGRLYVTGRLTERHQLRLLIAPLSVEQDGQLEGPVEFAGSSFAPGPVRGTYTFNSYRLTYRYRFRETDRLSAWVGFTAKIRDAEVALEQGSTSSSDDNVGFVPLLHLAADWRVAPDWSLSLDVDALAGGPGRAVDAALKTSYDLSDRWSVSAGYRTVEGGADVDSVYNFAWLHYAVVSVAWRR